MPKSLLSLVLLLAFHWHLAAQKTLFQNAPTLPGEKKSLNFSISEVIDARLHTGSCGFWSGETDAQSVPIDFEEGLEKGIQKLLPQLFEFSETENQICLAIREFWISSTDPSVAPTHLSILYDFYYKKEGQYFRLLRDDSEWDGVFTESLHGHQKNIVQSLEEAFAQLNQFNWATLAVDQTEGKKQNRSDVLSENQDFAIANGAPLKAGIYWSFREFRANEPSITEVNIQIKKGKEESILEKRDVQFKGLAGKHKKRDFSRRIWGFCDGERVYINNWAVSQEYSFSPLISIGQYCPFIGRENIRKDAMAMGTPMNVEGEKRAYAFDAEQGQAYLLDREFLKKILTGRGDLLHKYHQERDKDNLLTITWYVSASTKFR